MDDWSSLILKEIFRTLLIEFRKLITNILRHFWKFSTKVQVLIKMKFKMNKIYKVTNEANFFWEYFSLQVEFLWKVKNIYFGEKFKLVYVLNHKERTEMFHDQTVMEFRKNQCIDASVACTNCKIKEIYLFTVVRKSI